MRRAVQISFRKTFLVPAAFAASQLRFAKLFTDTHEWVDFNAANKTATVGITHHAQDALGDVVYVGLPEVGDAVEKASVAGEVESVKAASDYYSPIKGVVAEVNKRLTDEPSLVNESPEDQAWIFKLKDAEAPAGLMNAEEYKAFCEKDQH